MARAQSDLSWRPRAAASPAPAADGRAWRRESGAAGNAARWGRRAWLGLLGLAFLAGAGLLVWAVFWFRPPPSARLVLVGAGYETNLAVPPNVYGRESLRALAAWAGDAPRAFPWRSGLLQLQNEPTELRTDAAWDRGLDSAGERTVVVAFFAHGGADDDGPYLLRGDALPSAGEKGRLRLSDIIGRLKKLPARTNKLLVLDAGGMGPSWALGMPHNDFARALDGMEADIAAVPNLAVLSAAGPDQVSWPDEGSRRTVFGRCLLQGLEGAADENGDGRVNAWELYHYAAGRVEEWTRSRRDAIQTPVLLPHGTEGERRARAMHLTLVAARGAGDAPPDAPAVVNTDALRRAWDRARDLSRLTPPPARYTPYAWARYRAALVRYEQLMRAGDETNAEVVQGLLPDLEEKIRQAGKLHLASAENTLAMTAATAAGAPPEQAAVWFNALWGAKPEEVRSKWEELQTGKDAPADPAARRRLRAGIAERAADAAARDPAVLRRAAELMRVTEDPLVPDPAESHFLRMLARDLPTPPTPAALLTDALRLRVAAERVALAVPADGAAYSEQVFPWVRPTVEEADRPRQAGQDMLFAPEPERTAAAADQFREARKGYDRAAEDGAVVTAALEARNTAFADLPAYARWAALRPYSADPVQNKADEALLAQVERLAADAHRLADLLEQPPPAAGRPSEALGRLRQQGEAVRDGLHSLEGRFLESANAAADQLGLRARQEGEAALTIPFADASLRLRLINNSAAVDERLARQGAADKAFPINPDLQRAAVMDLAKRQGRAALAVIGQRLFDALNADKGDERYELVAHRLELFSAEQSWWESLGRAGEQIGRHYRRLASDAAARLEEARKADVDPARVTLRGAEAESRLLDGSEEPGWDAEPAERFLRMSMHDLLLWQAGRTLEDHWFGENGEPYYQKAGLAYLEDARRLVGPAQATQSVGPAEEALNRPGRLTLGPAGPVALTSEPELSFECAVAPAAGASLPPGLPSFRLEAGPDVEAAFPDGRPYRVADLRPGRPVEPVAVVVRRADPAADADGPPSAPKRERAEVIVHGFFRGQKMETPVAVDVDPVPARVYYEFPPPRGRAVAVRADRHLREEYAPAAGAVTVVLDCSGSMGPDENNPQAPSKFDVVTRALETVLRRLPRGTTLSLWAFGQAVGDRKTVEKPEETITRVQGPTAWDPDDADQRAGLMARVRALEPWNETPLVRAMLEAKEDLAHARGFKTLLVLTDGMDNRFDKDPRFREKTIPEVLKSAFQDAGVVIRLVGFNFAEGEEEKAYEQFKGIEALPLPGSFVSIHDADKLAAELDRALRQKVRYWVDREDGGPLPGVPEAGLDVSANGGNDSWFSLPDAGGSSEFKVAVQTNRRWQQDVAVGPGELLPLQVRAAGDGRHELRRAFVTADDYGDRPEAHTDAWRLAVLQNQRLSDRRLQMLLMLEKSPERPEALLQQLRPRETWVELEPAEGGAAPFDLRWGAQPGYAAPAYGLDVAAWPARAGGDGPARPVVRMWWNPGESEADAYVERDAGRPSLLGLRNVARVADGVTVVVESVQVERRRVEVRPGVFEPRDCLTVRLSHPPGRPFKVEPVGVSPAGQEQRFYEAAGKTTALFWPVGADEARDALTRLNLISVERLKNDARRDGHYLEIKTLKEPTRQDARPQPPVELSYVAP